MYGKHFVHTHTRDMKDETPSIHSQALIETQMIMVCGQPRYWWSHNNNNNNLIKPVQCRGYHKNYLPS